MFLINDYVIYGTTGVCQITDIRKEIFSGHVKKEYYILQPVFSCNSTLYVPTENESGANKMRRILTRDEIYELIRNMPEDNAEWIINDNMRHDKCTEIIKNGDRKELIRLIKAMYQHKQEQTKFGKKFYIADEKLMKAAEKLLYNEFALVLNIEPEEVVPYITEHLSEHLKY